MIQNECAIPSVSAPLTHKSLCLFQFSAPLIKSIRNNLDPNKTQGHDMISIDVVKLSGVLQTIGNNLKSCLNQGIFPGKRKKANVV